ncbi:metal ABC transporter substrate-binding protein [Anthocerotibacter panamensis]|uniref:metal ABC transporter substrate-binding protein n=1 Tax=Anthocerotibacter panamensis TaxID=2857077 RepID=UPI001C406C4A|nr:zinc ABC transporter substrate-binding protein [Anthocerotibacter panamensis]
MLTGVVQAQPLRILVTVAPLSAFAQAVIGTQGEVDVLVPPGMEVHDYQARPTDIAKIRRADVLIQNGLGLEEFLAGLVDNAAAPHLRVIDTSRGISSLAGSSNPHIWLDPLRAKQQVFAIRDGLSALNPSLRRTYQANAQVYGAQLDQLDQRYRQVLGSRTRALFMTLDPTFAYLAQRYHLQQVTLFLTGENSLSPRRLRAILDAVRHERAGILFTRKGFDRQLLQPLQEDLGVKLCELDTLEGKPLEPKGYLRAMYRNLVFLEQGLGSSR